MTVEPGVPEESADPLAPIESAILETQRGILPITELLRAFMDTQIIVPSAAPAESLQAIEPLLVNPGSQYFSFVIPPVAAASMRKEFGV